MNVYEKDFKEICLRSELRTHIWMIKIIRNRIKNGDTKFSQHNINFLKYKKRMLRKELFKLWNY